MLRLILCSLLASAALAVALGEQQADQDRSKLLSEKWGQILDGQANSANPVDRAVNLLKEMSKTLQKDMDDDEEQYEKMECWCNENGKAKSNAIKDNTAKKSELESSIEELTASSAALKVKINELKGEVVDNKNTLAKATALRKQELADFNQNEKEGVANIANLKAAIGVLSKHHGAALPQINTALSFLSVKRRATRRDEPWGLESKDQRQFDMFMGGNGFVGLDSEVENVPTPETRLRQQPSNNDQHREWSFEEVAAIQRAIKTATLFQRRNGQDENVPEYSSGSGEIFGILRQLEEDMSKDVKEAQETEASRASSFADLRKAKTAEISGGEKSVDQKEAEKSKADTDLEEAKEDLDQTTATLAQDEKFYQNLKATCKKADEDFAERKESRMGEMKAVSETIEILSADEAKDAQKGTFKKASFLQISRSRTDRTRRRQAARVLRRAAARSGNAELALLANSAELDAFTKVKAAIDKMVETLKTQQSDEVKKNDFCTSELESNEMATLKAEDEKGDLKASVEERDVALKKLEEEIEAGKTAIKKEQVSLQKATENRKKENLDFQKTLSDQMLTVAVLKKAMERLAAYYDEAGFIQANQEPPPAPKQVEFKPSGSAPGVMSLIEKLIYDAKKIMKESQRNEADSQKAYEELVEDSNGTIKALTKQVSSKTDAKVETHKDHTQKSKDLKQTKKDLENLGKLDKDLHEECDFVMKNFMIRQKARGEEVESLQQAKSVLTGALV